jgi:hypothetical protein
LDLGPGSAAAAANACAAAAAVAATNAAVILETANTLASDRQTMLISLRGEAPLCYLRPGVPQCAADGSRQPPMSGLGEFAGNWLRRLSWGSSFRDPA